MLSLSINRRTVSAGMLSLIAVSVITACTNNGDSRLTNSPIPGAPEEWFSGNIDYILNDPQTACDVFNENVAKINGYILDKYPDDSALVSENLCQAIRVEDVQIEDSAEYNLPVAGWWGRGWRMVDYVAIARTIDVLIFSSNDQADYLTIVNGSADLYLQDPLDDDAEWEGPDMGPFFYERDRHFGNNWHGTNHTTYMSGQIAIDKAVKDTDDFFIGQHPDDAEYNAKLFEFLSDRCSNIDNSECIPSGGASNSGYFENRESFPEDDYADQYVTVAVSQGMSFDIGGTFEAEYKGSPSAGMSVGFGYSTSTESSQEFKMFYVESFGLQNDIGSQKYYNISGNAVEGVTGFIDYIDDNWDYRVDNADEVFGSQAWRKHDLASAEVTRETINSNNCNLGNEQLAFGNTLNLSRSTIDFDGGNWEIDLDDTETVNHRFDYGVIVDMTCVIDENDQAFKYVSTGALSQVN